MGEQAARRGFTVRGPKGLGYIKEFGVYAYAVQGSRDVRERGWNTSLWLDGDTGALRSLDLPTGEHSGNTISNGLGAALRRRIRLARLSRLRLRIRAGRSPCCPSPASISGGGSDRRENGRRRAGATWTRVTRATTRWSKPPSRSGRTLLRSGCGLGPRNAAANFAKTDIEQLLLDLTPPPCRRQIAVPCRAVPP